MRALVAGWFSYEIGHATAGDVLTKNEVCDWLKRAGIEYDVAAASPFEGDVDWREIDPEAYTHVVFVCGPFHNEPLERDFLSRFRKSRLIGLNLTMTTPLDEWSPFDLLMERDSSRNAHPDIAFLGKEPLVPVVGVCLVEEYDGAKVREANEVIRELIARREVATVFIDTRLDYNETSLRTSAEVESLLARMDVVLTTRLHGMVLSLKNTVPVIAIDPEEGGAKVRRQAERIGWPMHFNVGEVTIRQLEEALDWCLTEAARRRAREVANNSSMELESLRDAVVAALREGGFEKAYEMRLAALEKLQAENSIEVNGRKPTPGLIETVLSRTARTVRRVLSRQRYDI